MHASQYRIALQSTGPRMMACNRRISCWSACGLRMCLQSHTLRLQLLKRCTRSEHQGILCIVCDLCFMSLSSLLGAATPYGIVQVSCIASNLFLQVLRRYAVAEMHKTPTIPSATHVTAASQAMVAFEAAVHDCNCCVNDLDSLCLMDTPLCDASGLFDNAAGGVRYRSCSLGYIDCESV